MYEDILGRPASLPEQKMLNAGFRPGLSLGDLVETFTENAIRGAIDGIVLFAVPHLPGAPGPQLAWGFRIEGVDEFLPQIALQRVPD